MSMRTAESVTLLDNGCMCCTVRSDLVTAVKNLLDRAELAAANARASDGAFVEGDEAPLFDGILIETTGLADPGPVVKTFYADDDLRDRTRVNGVVTLVDARHFVLQLRRDRSLDAVNETAQQVAFADRILLNKVDMVSENALKQVEEEIRHINQLAPVFRCSLASRPTEVPLHAILTSDSFSLDRVLQDLDAPPPERARKTRKLDHVAHHHEAHGVDDDGHDGGHHDHHEHDKFKGDEVVDPSRGHGHEDGHGHGHGETSVRSRHDSGIGTCSYGIEGAPLVLQQFMQVMNSLRAEHAVDLYRYKGVLCVKEPGGAVKRGVLQGVHDMCIFEPRGAWPSELPPCSKLVFIGRKLDTSLWGRLFEKCKEGVLS